MIGRFLTARRAGAGISRAALVALLTLVGLMAVPGSASAAAQVTPVLNCTTPAADGSFIAVVGYDNTTGADVTIPYGHENRFTPTRYDGAQPTTFAAGRHDGAFTVTVSTSSAASWVLGEQRLHIKASEAPACPSSTELPEEGNGTGSAIALVAAGLVGGVLVHRARRRATAGTGDGDA